MLEEILKNSTPGDKFLRRDGKTAEMISNGSPYYRFLTIFSEEASSDFPILKNGLTVNHKTTRYARKKYATDIIYKMKTKMKDQESFVLYPAEMRTLRELGMDLEDANLYWECLPTGYDYLEVSDDLKVPLFWTKSDKGTEIIPAYTLDNVLEKLSKGVKIENNQDGWSVGEYRDKTLLQAAYKELKHEISSSRK